MDFSLLAAPRALFSPLSPNPSRPAGREGGLTAEFDFFAPTTALLARGCDCYFARRFFAYGRRDDVVGGRANGGRAAARWGRDAACSGSANPLPAPTTVGSPIVASKLVSQRPASSTAVGATKPNSAVNSPLAQRGERGWGRVGANKATVTSQVTNQTTTSNFARMPAAATPLPPLSPNPSRPAGREGGLTAEFDFFAPITALLARSCDCYFARRFFAYGRRDYVACRRANGGRDAARWVSANPLRATIFARRLIANGRRDDVAGRRANGGRDAACSGSANPLPAPTTVGSPIVASKHVPQRPAGSPVFGATKSNSAVSSPLAQRGERGWGRVGANKAGLTSHLEAKSPRSAKKGDPN